MSAFSGQMERQGSFLLEVTPRITIPEVRTTFPLYIGLGAGIGFYPKHIVRKLPAMSLNSQFFIGLRVFDIYHNLGFSTEINLRIHFPFNELNIYLETLGQMGLIFRF